MNTLDKKKQEKYISYEDMLVKSKTNNKEWEIVFWLDIEKWEYDKITIDKMWNIWIFWLTGSGKTNFLKWIIFQLLDYKNSEIVLLHHFQERDLSLFKNKEKFVYKKDILNLNNNLDEFSHLVEFLNNEIENRKNKLKELWYDWNYDWYKNEVMLKDTNAEQISNLIVIMDEYATFRERVSKNLEWKNDEFDKIMKDIVSNANKYGISIIFSSQNLIEYEVWKLKDLTKNQFVGYSKQIWKDYIKKDDNNFLYSLKDTYLFYHIQKDNLLKIPVNLRK